MIIIKKYNVISFDLRILAEDTFSDMKNELLKLKNCLNSHTILKNYKR